VLGICSFVVCCVTGVPAIILGALGLSDINDSKRNLSGKGMAISGIVLGSISLLFLPLVLIALLLPAVQAAREAARRAMCVNNLKMIALGMHNYESAKGRLPPAATYDAHGKPLLSWRVLILPYVEQESLYSQFHLDEPWDSPHNKPLADQMPTVFQCPSRPLPEGQTTYEVIVDPSSLFRGTASGVTIPEVTDGLQNTLMVVEAADPVPWSKPEDLSLASNSPAFGIGSNHPGVVNAAMGDGSVRSIKSFTAAPASRDLIKALATRNGNEPVNPP
jgi:prepilin-type processing-associated H-X9-DG protein